MEGKVLYRAVGAQRLMALTVMVCRGIRRASSSGGGVDFAPAAATAMLRVGGGPGHTMDWTDRSSCTGLEHQGIVRRTR